MPRRSALLAPMIAMALAIVGVVWLLAEKGPGGLSGAQKQTTGALVGGLFELVDHTGRAVTDEDFRGRFLLVYFGFTTCPDVCPTALQEMTQALDLLGEQGNEIQPLLVTIDPERDTPAVLAERLIPLHPVTQYEGATQLSVGERVDGRESALCLGLSRVAPLRA